MDRQVSAHRGPVGNGRLHDRRADPPLGQLVAVPGIAARTRANRAGHIVRRRPFALRRLRPGRQRLGIDCGRLQPHLLPTTSRQRRGQPDRTRPPGFPTSPAHRPRHLGRCADHPPNRRPRRHTLSLSRLLRRVQHRSGRPRISGRTRRRGARGPWRAGLQVACAVLSRGGSPSGLGSRFDRLGRGVELRAGGAEELRQAGSAAKEPLQGCG